jgi:FMN phosphatase YigB (HAD superfamily)
MDTFIPAYLQVLGDHLSSIIEPDVFVPTLLSATQIMLQNNRPDQTLKEVFDQAFFPSLSIDPDEFQVYLDSFYKGVFPQLKELTEFWPQAVDLVEKAFDRGYSVVIATNPLFPLTAIIQRLEWAGLSPQEYQFELIPSYESYRFAKPNPSFFAETLSRLGWPERPVVMVGDDYNNDISSAHRMGLGTFWISENEQPQSDTSDSIHGSGSISDFIPWLDSIPSEHFLPNYSSQDATLAILHASPAVLSTFSEDLNSVHWTENPQPGEWSFTEVLCHLRDVDREVNIPRIEKVLSETNPFLSGIDSDKWAIERLYYCQNGFEALKDFTSSRIHLLDVLEGLNQEDYSRQARHAIFGPTNLLEMIGIIASHDRLHVRQAYQALQEITLRSRKEAGTLDTSL